MTEPTVPVIGLDMDEAIELIKILEDLSAWIDDAPARGQNQLAAPHRRNVLCGQVADRPAALVTAARNPLAALTPTSLMTPG